MKVFSIILSMALFLGVCSFSVAQGAEVTKVSREKWNKLTPEQKEKFKELGRKAQKSAQDSMDDYNDVEDSVDPDKVKVKVHDYMQKNFGPNVKVPPCGAIRN